MQHFPFSFLGLSAHHAMIALFYLSLFSLYHTKRYCYLLYRPVSTSPFPLIPGLLSSCHLRGFVWLLTRPLCFSSSCLSFWEKTLQVACWPLVGRWARWEGDIAEVEYTHVAAFAVCITVDPMYLLLFFWLPKLILSTATQKHPHPLEGLSSDRWTCPKSSIGHYQLWHRWAVVRDGSSSPPSVILTHRHMRKTCCGLVTTASNVSPFLQTVLAKPHEKWDMFITASYWMFTAHSAAKR